MNNPDNGASLAADLLVVGGGIAGITAAIEASEMGQSVMLVESTPFLGGRVAQMNQYFPKMCPPLCGLEINYKRLRQNDKVKVLTLTTVAEINGSAGGYEVKLTTQPRFVNENCTACGECEKACAIEVPNERNYGIDQRKAIYMPEMAFPPLYVVDAGAAQDERMKACVEACKYQAIDLKMPPQNLSLKASNIIWATGWKPYDATKLDNLGFGKFRNVITNVMLERLAARDGPTAGKIARLSDQGAITKMVFAQCAGSRDENHLPYCSGVCCSASLKQAQYIREQYPEAEIHLFYIDVRTPGRLEDMYTKLQSDAKMYFHRGKVAEVRETGHQNLIVAAENTLTGEIAEMEVELVVLATGMEPNAPNQKALLNGALNEWGFLKSQTPKGIVGAGVAHQPADVAASVQDATGAVLRTLALGGRN